MKKIILSLSFLLLMGQVLFPADKPNIVFFIADDVSQDDFGALGVGGRGRLCSVCLRGGTL